MPNVVVIERVTNILPSKKTEEDWSIEDAEKKGLIPKIKMPVPDKMDLREDWWHVGNQLDTGACVGWALADGVIRWYFTKSGKIKETQKLSARYLWMASKELDYDNSRPTSFLEKSGTTLKDALIIATKFGLALEEDLPFIGTLSKVDEDVFFQKTANNRISAFFNLVKGLDKKENVRRWIASKGPVVASLIPDANWDQIPSDGKLEKYNGGIFPTAHAISIVGYYPGGFIVRNSFGTQWGAKGFALVSDAYLDQGFNECYGLIV